MKHVPRAVGMQPLDDYSSAVRVLVRKDKAVLPITQCGDDALYVRLSAWGIESCSEASPQGVLLPARLYIYL